MKVLLKRFDYQESQVLGDMHVFNERNGVEYSCKTLELAWKNNERRVSCIPEGSYLIRKRWSKKYGDHFIVLEKDGSHVTGRDHILIHHGNYNRDILGCILVGQLHLDIDGDGLRDVTMSKSTMSELNELLPFEFNMEIQKA